jgi:2-polyprenyl-6-methoxyphenol hydroxylase-like FAD-dependent oxidoreductase
MRILIAGAGIGGLSTALSLEAVGFSDVQIFESAHELRSVGVGLNLLPNAVRELTELGVFDPLAAQAVETSELLLFHRSGGLVWREPRGRAAGYAWPQLSVHRAHLQNVLAHAVRERLGEDAIRTNMRVVGHATTRSKGVSVAVRHDRTDGAIHMEEHADLLIAADGIHSAVRAQHYPDEGEPLANGLIMWRGMSRAAPFLTGSSMAVIGDMHKKLVVYPVAPPDAGTGKQLVNWVGARPDTCVERDPETVRRHALEFFHDLSVTWLDIPSLISASETIMEHPMQDRDPVTNWVFGRAVLLGDAAHPMYPAGSNGATQAIVDARVLAHALATSGSTETALMAYERERLPAMSRIQHSNREMGPERVIDLVHQRAPDGFVDINQVISEEELQTVSATYANIGGFEPEELNARPSYTVERSTSRRTASEVTSS